jgi:leucyl/phenylalanyl-tRNA--protein transferase
MQFHDPRQLKLNTVLMRAKRDDLFRETPLEVVERCLLGTAWALRPKRIGALPALGALWLKDLIAPSHGLPDPERTWHDNGMCGIVHDLSIDTLVNAYSRGLFTFAHFGPLKWMSLPERCVLFFDEMHTSKRVARMSRNGKFTVTFDQAFEDVIKACAGRRQNKWHVTWITPQIMHAYATLYDAGYVHSFEVWNEQGTLVGGGYGVACGRVFFTESQFSYESDASKLGFAVLNRHLAEWGYVLNDGKWPTPTITPMGFRNIPRRTFLDLVEEAVKQPGRDGRWQAELRLDKRAQPSAA